MIENEIAKFVNSSSRGQLLLVAELGEALLVAVRSGRLLLIPLLPSVGRSA